MGAHLPSQRVSAGAGGMAVSRRFSWVSLGVYCEYSGFWRVPSDGDRSSRLGFSLQWRGGYRNDSWLMNGALIALARN